MSPLTELDSHHHHFVCSFATVCTLSLISLFARFVLHFARVCVGEWSACWCGVCGELRSEECST